MSAVTGQLCVLHLRPSLATLASQGSVRRLLAVVWLMMFSHVFLCPTLCPLQWHALSREEQAKYYELARKERQLHMQLYPGWSARDNYVGGPFIRGHFP